MSGGEIHITGKAATLLRASFPVDELALQQKAGRIIVEWLEEQEAEKALKKAIRHNKGKGSISAEELYRQCGL